jgi:flagellar assembly protein FliH
MWCKVYDGTAAVEPVFWPSADGSPPLGSLSNQRRGGQEQTAGVDQLQRRIAQLEAQADAHAREAHQAGIAEGRRAAAAELEPAMQRLAKTLEELSRYKSRLRKEAESDLVTLALAVARRILRRELSVDAEALQGVVTAALEKLQVRELSRVRVHPSHEDAVRRQLSNVHNISIQLVGDSTLQPGDVLFETTRGTVDGSIDSQLREIERGFADVLTR